MGNCDDDASPCRSFHCGTIKRNVIDLVIANKLAAPRTGPIKKCENVRHHGDIQALAVDTPEGTRLYEATETQSAEIDDAEERIDRDLERVLRDGNTLVVASSTLVCLCSKHLHYVKSSRS